MPATGRCLRGRAFRFVVEMAACAAFTGCAADQRNPANDPLLGGRSAPPGTIAGGPATPPPVPAATAIPPSSFPSSTAALASGPAPLDRSTPACVIGTEPAPVPNNPAGSGWGLPAQPVLQTPEPAAGSMARSRINPPIPPPITAGSYEQAQQVLRGRGVTWQRLETWGDKGEWKFTCVSPTRRTPPLLATTRPAPTHRSMLFTPCSTSSARNIKTARVRVAIPGNRGLREREAATGADGDLVPLAISANRALREREVASGRIVTSRGCFPRPLPERCRRSRRGCRPPWRTRGSGR